MLWKGEKIKKEKNNKKQAIIEKRKIVKID